MQWVHSDLKNYIHEKEYVDTLLVPLIPYHLSGDDTLLKDAFQREVLSIFVREIEKELTGRIMLIPDYNYLKSTNRDKEVDRLNLWVTDTRKQPFKHIFFVTFDSTWKKVEKALAGDLLWLPGIQSGNLQSSEMHSFIHDQAGQIRELVRSYWKG